MKDMLYYEACKLWHQTGVRLFLLVLFALRVFQLYCDVACDNEQGFSMSDLAAVHGQLGADLDMEEKAAHLLELESEGFTSEGRDAGKRNALDRVCRDFEQISGYSDYLRQIGRQAERMQAVSFLGGADSYACQSIAKTAHVYEKLENTRPCFLFLDGIRLVTDDRLCYLLCIACVVVFCMGICLYDFEYGMAGLINTTKRGNRQYVAGKCLMIVFSVAALQLLYDIPAFGVGCFLSGGRIFEVPVQSIPGYLASPFSVSVGQYLILSFAVRLFGLLLIGAVTCVVCFLCGSLVSGVLAVVVFGGAEYLCKSRIDLHSRWSLLRQVNIVSFFDTSIFRDYEHVNICGIPVSAMSMNLLAGFCLLVVCASVIINLHRGGYAVGEKKGPFSRLTEKRGSFGLFLYGLFSCELYKGFIICRGLQLLVFFCVVQMVTYGGKMHYADGEEYYYRNYSVKLEGRPNDEKKRYIEAERQHLEDRRKKQADYYGRYANGEIGKSELDAYIEFYVVPQEQDDGLRRAENQFERLEALLADGEEVSYVYLTPWSALCGPDTYMEAMADIAKMIICIVVFLAVYLPVEQRSRMCVLMNTFCKGRKTLLAKKYQICALFCFLVLMITIVTKYFAVFSNYPAIDWNVTARSILFLPEMPFTLSAGVYLLFVQGSKYIVLAGGTCLILKWYEGIMRP